MVYKKITFYLFCIFLIVTAIFLFEIRFAIIFISTISIIISLLVAIFKVGLPPFKKIYLDWKHDFIEFFRFKDK